MKLTKNIVTSNLNTSIPNQLELNLSNLQLGSIKNLNQYIQSDKLITLNVDKNYLKIFDADFSQFVKLQSLSAELNFLYDSVQLINLQNLKELNLSTNKFRQLIDFSNLISLEFLDVSRNQIIYIEKLPNSLKTLIAHHNQLQQIHFITENLTLVDLSFNQIKSMLLINKCQLINSLNLQNNNIPESQFSDLLLLLQNKFEYLKQLVLKDNPIANSADYMMNILSLKVLEKLDHIIITPYIYKAFSQLKNEQDINKVVKETQQSYNNRIRTQLQLKNKILQSLRQKQQKVERTFEQYRNKNRSELQQFINRCNRNLLKDGKDLEQQRRLMKNFEVRLKEIEKQNQLTAEKRKQQLEVENKLMNLKIAKEKQQIYTSPEYKNIPKFEQIVPSTKKQKKINENQQLRQFKNKLPNNTIINKPIKKNNIFQNQGSQISSQTKKNSQLRNSMNKQSQKAISNIKLSQKQQKIPKKMEIEQINSKKQQKTTTKQKKIGTQQTILNKQQKKSNQIKKIQQSKQPEQQIYNQYCFDSLSKNYNQYC